MTSRAVPKRRSRSSPPAAKPPAAKRPAAKRPTAEPPADRTETQQRLLDAAVGLFAERGFDGVTTAEIAARAKVAEKTLFANFGTKERLYQEALQPATVLAAMAPEALRTLAPVFTDPPSDPRALLRALLENRVRFARAHRREVKLLVQHVLLRPEGIRGITDTWSERMAPLVMPVMERLIASGAVRSDVPPLALVRFIAANAFGYVLSAVVLRPDLPWDDEREIAHLADLIADGLAPRPITPR